MNDIAIAGGKVTGQPVEQVERIIEGVGMISEGDVESGAFLSLGWPDSVASPDNNSGRLPSF